VGAEGLGGASVSRQQRGRGEGLEPIAEMDVGHRRWMYEVNVLGLAMMTKALLPPVRRSGGGRVVIIGSAAGTETYARGAGYTAAEFGAHAVFGSLRLELPGEDVRGTEVIPGPCAPSSASCASRATSAKAEAPYKGITPPTPDDVAGCVRWAVSLPPHVNVDRLEVGPVRRQGATLFARA
jgi:NADP-dependent 3-hydroxy acid dehydrogenase YdfG